LLLPERELDCPELERPRSLCVLWLPRLLPLLDPFRDFPELPVLDVLLPRPPELFPRRLVSAMVSSG